LWIEERRQYRCSAQTNFVRLAGESRRTSTGSGVVFGSGDVADGSTGELTRWSIMRQCGTTRRGRPRPQNDTWIAADCLAYNLPLATLNTTDFSDIIGHEVLVLV
jgi:hypothetical protein